MLNVKIPLYLWIIKRKSFRNIKIYLKLFQNPKGLNLKSGLVQYREISRSEQNQNVNYMYNNIKEKR